MSDCRDPFRNQMPNNFLPDVDSAVCPVHIKSFVILYLFLPERGKCRRLARCHVYVFLW